MLDPSGKSARSWLCELFNAPSGLGSYSAMRAHFATIRGIQTRYFASGSGPLLLLVHPVGYPAEVFTRTLAGLADAYTVVAPDLPGQGYSELPKKMPGSPQSFMAAHMLALADHLGASRFAVLGSSLGGIVAALMALRFPERINRLVVVGSGSVFNEPSSQRDALKRVYANGSRAYAEPSLTACRERMRNSCFRLPEAEDVLLTQITAYALPGAAASYKAIVEGLADTVEDPDHTVYPHLEQIAAPTLVIVGANDNRTSAQAHRTGAGRIPGAQFISLDDCGHLPYLEQPERFNDLIRRFLAGEQVGERLASNTSKA